jgi:hypothetical protein
MNLSYEDFDDEDYQMALVAMQAGGESAEGLSAQAQILDANFYRDFGNPFDESDMPSAANAVLAAK